MTEVKKEWIKLIVLLLILTVSFNTYGQTISLDAVTNHYKIPPNSLDWRINPVIKINADLPKRQSIMYQKAVFRADQLPIFCKIEHLLGLQSHFPVKIRLGDVDYVEKLESK